MGLLHKLAFYALYPVTKPLADIQAQLTRIEQRLNPLETWFNNLNQWAYDEGERSKRILELAELLIRLRAELNANAHIVTEASVYFERAVRELLDKRPQPDAVPIGDAHPEVSRPAGR